MDANMACSQPDVLRGFDTLPSDVMQELLDDHMDVFGAFKMAFLKKGIWTTLQFYIYRRAAEHRKGRCRGRIRNIIKSAIRNGAEIKTLEMMIEACKPVWPWWVAGYDHWQVYPPLFIAAEKNRIDVIELLVANGIDINTTYLHRYFRPRHAADPRTRERAIVGKHYGLHGHRRSWDSGYEADTILDIAIRNRNKGLLEHFLEDSRIQVDKESFLHAINIHWKVGIEAILEYFHRDEKTFSWMQKMLNREMLLSAKVNDPEWLEYLISLGADPKAPNDRIHEDIPITRSLDKGNFLNVFRILRVAPFEWEDLVRVLLQCVLHDDRLEITKVLLVKTCQYDTRAWMEAYGYGLNQCTWAGSNIKTMRFLLEYLEELIQSERQIDMDASLKYIECGCCNGYEGESLFERALKFTVGIFPYRFDWVRPLFHLDVDVTKWLTNEKSYDRYRQYFAQFVHTRDDHDKLLSLYRQPKIDIDAVFDSRLARDGLLWKLDSLEDEWTEWGGNERLNCCW